MSRIMLHKQQSSSVMEEYTIIPYRYKCLTRVDKFETPLTRVVMYNLIRREPIQRELHKSVSFVMINLLKGYLEPKTTGHEDVRRPKRL